MNLNGNRKYAVYDFETTSADPLSTEIVQAAVVMVDCFSLEIVDEFCEDFKPTGIDKDGWLTKERQDTLNFHARTQNKSADEILERWKAAPSQKISWNRFVKFIQTYSKDKSPWNSPIQSGYNIIGFDAKIVERYKKKFKTNTLFYPRDTLDLMHAFYLFFEGTNNGPKNLKLDTLREYFGMDTAGAHDALVDCRQTAELLCRLLRMCRHMFKKSPGLQGKS